MSSLVHYAISSVHVSSSASLSTSDPPNPFQLSCNHQDGVLSHAGLRLTAAHHVGTAHCLLITRILLSICPELEVILEELHDEGRIPVRLLVKAVEELDGVVESSLCQVRCLGLLFADLVEEHRVVERQPKPDTRKGARMSRDEQEAHCGTSH